MNRRPHRAGQSSDLKHWDALPRPSNDLRFLAALSLPLLAVVAVTACGRSGGEPGGRDAAVEPVAPSTVEAPAALAANAAQADEFVGEGVEDFEERLARLRGHPVVVNQWASWCDPCRFEIPFFRAMTARYGDRVAFVGIDLQDDRDAAEDFMEELPSGFPSIFDADGSVTRSLGGGRASPTTFYLDRNGKRVFTKIGAYASVDQLEEDIRRHALGERS